VRIDDKAPLARVRVERRARPRSPMSIGIMLHVPSQRVFLPARIVDLSSMGAWVLLSRTVPIGETVSVQFDRGEKRNPLSIEAEVVRVSGIVDGKPAGLALRFTEATELDEALISTLILQARS
jgi:hypothetical protein